MIELPEFEAFPKIPRFSRGAIITEKIDGTNAVIRVTDDGSDLIAGSRSRWITPEADNFGFARWVQEYKAELLKLGPGSHFGEWWGSGIQRRYGIKEKRFSLFNIHRWFAERPDCCHVVPVIWTGGFDQIQTGIELALGSLRTIGSAAAPGFMDPEGIVILHEAGRCVFKKTLNSDDEPKSKSSEAA